MSMVAPRISCIVFILAACCVSTAQESMSPEEQAELVKARASYRSGQLTEAVAEYQTIITNRPKSANAFSGLARTLLKKDQVADALDAAKKSLTADPKCPDAHVAMGEVYFRKGLMRE